MCRARCKQPARSRGTARGAHDSTAEVGGGPGGGTYVYLWLVHVGVSQKPMRCCKAIILQLKIKLKHF